jgi:hypothetical protein
MNVGGKIKLFYSILFYVKLPSINIFLLERENSEALEKVQKTSRKTKKGTNQNRTQSIFLED